MIFVFAKNRNEFKNYTNNNAGYKYVSATDIRGFVITDNDSLLFIYGWENNRGYNDYFKDAFVVAIQSKKNMDFFMKMWNEKFQ
jgi:hypothetical protein